MRSIPIDMSKEKAPTKRPRGTPIDRGIALMRTMEPEVLQDFAAVVRGFVAGRSSAGQVTSQVMVELGKDAATEDQK
jgi:hypothetical protein